jgi:DNA mismatch repair protein MutL
MDKNSDVIEVLSQSVIEKIAAGETIERPASVLKELIENAIDAGASKISIVIQDAGFSVISVTDNGRGMSAANIQKSVLRHATSKIRLENDLYAIGTLGFRGEALASIGAVSRMSVSSSDQNGGLGASIRCEGGVCENPQPVSHVKGTTVESRDLFFNTPARKKFMKSERSERLALMRLLEYMVIPFPEIHFIASFDGITAFDTPPAASIRERIAQIGGTGFAANLVACSAQREGMEVELYLTRPDESRGRPRFQNLYVNFRKVECDPVLYAIREAFSQFTKSEFKPSFFCFIDVDPAAIDVNVHPTKQKIKFEDEKKLFGFIFETAKRGLRETVVSKQEAFSGVQTPYLASMRRAPDHPGAASPAYVHEAEADKVYPPQPLVETGQTILAFAAAERFDNKALDARPDNTIQLSDNEQEAAWSLISCYQIHAMFILAPIKNGILLIDQHAAHERILFEQALGDLDGGRADSQQLLFPIIIELSPTEKSVVLSGSDYFRKFGFEIQDFGGNAVSLSALPAFMRDSNAETAVRDMVRYLLEGKLEAHFTDAQKRFAAAFACGAAIKAGQKLSQEEMNGLLNSLFSTENPYICPHGRPTIVRMSTDELSRRFLR